MAVIDLRTKEGRNLAAEEAVRNMSDATVRERMPKLYYVEDSYNGGYRVGRTDWAGDAFNIVPKAEFDIFLKIYNGLSMPIEDKTYED